MFFPPKKTQYKYLLIFFLPCSSTTTNMTNSLSSNLLIIINLLTFLFSIPILSAGIDLSLHGATNCDKFLQTPLILIGILLLASSLVGFIGVSSRNIFLVWLYLFTTFFLILAALAFTVFALIVTNKGAGEAVSGARFDEYKLGDYSNWLQKRVSNPKNWMKIKSCLQDAKVCESLQQQGNSTKDEFFNKHLTSIQVFIDRYSCVRCKSNILSELDSNNSFFFKMLFSPDVVSLPLNVDSHTEMRRFGINQVVSLLQIQTAIYGRTTDQFSATTVNHAKPVLSTISRLTGKRLPSLTSSS